MDKKVTTRIETLRAAHRQATIGLALHTRVADKSSYRKDPKKDRRKWKKELDNE